MSPRSRGRQGRPVAGTARTEGQLLPSKGFRGHKMGLEVVWDLGGLGHLL